MKRLHYIAGLPRSCSTLLCNLLAQNPDYHVSGTSGLVELVHHSRRVLSAAPEFRAMDPAAAERLVLGYMSGGLAAAYAALTDRPVVFDKGRGWLGNLDLLFRLQPEAKVLVPVRDMRGVVASMERIHRRHPAHADGSDGNPLALTTTEKRAQAWLSSPALGLHIERIWEAAQRFRGKLYFVQASRLTGEPLAELERIYRYLGEAWFEGHDPANVLQYTNEHDGVWWPYGQHQIRPQVAPAPEDWCEVLGKPLSDSIKQKFDWITEL